MLKWKLAVSHNAESFLQVLFATLESRNTTEGQGLSGNKDLLDVSEVRVTELDVTKQTEKKVSFWLSRAQTRLAYLATVSCGIQGRPVLLTPPAASTIPPLLSTSAPFYCR